MSKILSTVVSAALVAAPLFYASASSAESGAQMVDIESYKCKDIMRMSGEERTVAVAVLHGYMLGKKAATKFDSDELNKISNDFIEYCLDNPSDQALASFTKFAK